MSDTIGIYGDENDDTIVEEVNIQSIVDKYKAFDPNSASNEDVIVLSDHESNSGPLTANESCLINQGITSHENNDDDVDDLLAKLSRKYNINCDWKNAELGSGIADKSPTPSAQYTSPAGSPQQTQESDFLSLYNCNNPISHRNKDLRAQFDPKVDEPEQLNLDVLRDDSDVDASVSKPNSRTSSATKRAEKLKMQAEKQVEREKKKEEAQRFKEIKKAIQMSTKNLKPEESIKFITAVIDNEVLNYFEGNEIIQSLETLGSAYKIQSQLIPNTITWIRKVESYMLNEEGKLTPSVNLEDADQILLLMSWKDFVIFVHERSLLAHFKGVQSMCPNKRVTLGIYGMEAYFRGKQKSHNLPKISRTSAEFSLTELQIFYNTCYRFIDKSEDIGALIAQFTKSIAQVPYKLEKQEKHLQAEWYMSGDNKDCVKVDKDGNGLQRLWQQQLTSFPMARIETAEAIINQYPSVLTLMEAYDNCDNEFEKENLLQDIPIRRAAGPLTNIRKIGPELSKKVYSLYNSLNGESML